MIATRSFNYHASAHALSGHLTRPENHLIQVQAGTALPSTGGHHASRVENFRYGGTVSFTAGHSHVSGSEKVENNKTIHTTLATTVIEGLNILDMVTADRIVARVASSYESGDESRILVIGSRFENLRIAGYKIDVELHHELALRLDTFAAVRKEFESNKDFRKMSDDPFEPRKLPTKVEAHEVVRCSLVKELHPPVCPGIVRHGHCGHVLVVPEFGQIHLAEIQFEHGRKTLRMLRVELGSPNGGTLVAAEGSSNGRPPG
jgi:hypothetical protein